MHTFSLHQTVRALLEDGKGILAADESVDTMNARLEERGILPSIENRRRYRELLFSTPGIERFLSGVILFNETIRDTLTSGATVPNALMERGILVGIKVDEGLEPWEGGKATKGLAGLAERVRDYHSLGAVFTKWRSVSVVGDGYADPATRENAKRIAEYARVVQAEGLVPIVEPEVLMEGAHDAEGTEAALIETLAITIDELQAARIDIGGMIIKTAMAVSGSHAAERANPAEVAERTVRALKTALPESVGGVVFLSGGQSPEEACSNLNAIARLEPLPWPITFSFARALQAPALAEWGGNEENVDEAQALFLKRISLAASAGAAAYSSDLENSAL